MADLTPRFVAGRRHDAALARSPDGDGLAAKIRIVPLLDGRIEGVHVDVDDLALSARRSCNRFTEKGLLRQVSVDGAKNYFDTNATAHHHFYLEDSRELVDIPVLNLTLQRMPEVPHGYDIERVELVVRLRRNLVRPRCAGS